MTVHAEFIFERNIFLLHKMLHLMSCSYFLGVPPSPRDPAHPFVSKYVLHIHTTYRSGILGQGGGGEDRISQVKNGP